MKRIKLIRQGYFKKANFDDWVKEGDSVRFFDEHGRMVRIERTFRNNKLFEKRIEKYTNLQIIKVVYKRYDDFHCKEKWSNYQCDNLGYKK